MKKLMILGGTRYAVPIIKIAHKLGLYVITADYLPDNAAHKYSDEYVNVNIIDREKTLEEAAKRNIDGIISFACDPGVITAAYVAEKMVLPFQGPYESVRILQDKGLFRDFLAGNGFNTPKFKRYTDKITPYSDIDYFSWPVIVKPVDSAGSKCITRANNPEELANAIDIAFGGSHCGAIIIEDFLTFKGYHSSGDVFTVDGELKFVSYSDEIFDERADNPYTPIATVWPTTMLQNSQNELTAETQRLMTLLNMKTGLYNIDSCVDSEGRTYLMEVSPRGGGCRIAEIQEMAYDVTLVENEIRKAVGMPLIDIFQTECKGIWGHIVAYSNNRKTGKLIKIYVDSEFEQKYVKLLDFGVNSGDYVAPLTGANMSLGDILLRIKSRAEFETLMSRINEWLHIDLVQQ